METIKIACDPIQLFVGQPYNTGQDGYRINLFLGSKSKKAKTVLSFDTIQEAQEFYDTHNEKFRIDFTDLHGTMLPKSESVLFDTLQEAQEFCKKNQQENMTEQDRELKRQEEQAIAELERSYRAYLTPSKRDDDPDAPTISDEEVDLDVLAADDNFFAASSEAMDVAKRLLKSIAELYIEQDVIDQYPYFKNKLYYEESSISMIHSQIMISQFVLKKFFRSIIQSPTAKNIESLAKIQSTLLQLAKYQREYLQDVELSFQKLKQDYQRGDFVQTYDDVPSEEVTDGTLLINDRKRLIQELQAITKEEGLIPLSPNSALREQLTEPDRFETEFKINLADVADEDDDSEERYSGDGSPLDSFID